MPLLSETRPRGTTSCLAMKADLFRGLRGFDMETHGESKLLVKTMPAVHVLGDVAIVDDMQAVGFDVRRLAGFGTSWVDGDRGSLRQFPSAPCSFPPARSMS